MAQPASALSLPSTQDGFSPIIMPRYTELCLDERRRGLNLAGAPLGSYGVTCRASELGDAGRALAIYPEFMLDGNIFSGEGESEAEKNKAIKNYSIQILNLVEQISKDFYLEQAEIDGRKVKDEELKAWVRAVFAVAQQEAFFTHYQLRRGVGSKVERLNAMSGDLIRGGGQTKVGSKGMFQILLRHHLHRTEADFFDLVQNINYGVSYAYQQWARVAGMDSNPVNFSSCQSLIRTENGINFKNAARAMYSMYNAGPSSPCRWANKNHRFSSHDEGYLMHYEEQPWTFWVSDKERHAHLTEGVGPTGRKELRFEFSFDLTCARQGFDFCMRPQEASSDFNERLESYSYGRLLRVERPEIVNTSFEENFCVYNSESSEFLCTTDQRNIPCLRGIGKFSHLAEAQRAFVAGRNLPSARSYYLLHRLSLDKSSRISMNFSDDKNRICRQNAEGVFVAGDFIQTKRTMNFRSEPNDLSNRIGRVESGSAFQVLDFVIQPSYGFSRWYRVAHETSEGQWKEGYIYGGNDADWTDWVAPVDSEASNVSHLKVIPQKGSMLKANRDLPVYASLVDLDKKENRQSLGRAGYLPEGFVFEVKDIYLVGENDELLVEVEFSKKENMNDSSIISFFSQGQASHQGVSSLFYVLKREEPSFEEKNPEKFIPHNIPTLSPVVRRGYVPVGFIGTSGGSVVESILSNVEVHRGEK